MKKELDLELKTKLEKKLENKEDFKVTYDGEDFEIYKYNKETDRYEGIIGYLTIKSIVEIIKGLNDFIELR